MSRSSAFIDPPVADYLSDHTTVPTELEQRLIDETSELAYARMQISTNQARFMAQMTRLLRPSLVVEIGVFTGYSSLVVASELEGNARLLACDISDEWTSIARRYWAEAGVAERIDLRLAPATETLALLDPATTAVDMAFIDADKGGYLDYFEALVPLLADRGVIFVDNVLWSGRVVDPAADDADTIALRAFNAHVLADPRVDVALLPIGDGLSMITRSNAGS